MGRIVSLLELGTIPAGAGEPKIRASKRRKIWDHPRGCGGTLFSTLPLSIDAGPSPRVRGNQALALFFFLLEGTIPAGAGEPHDVRFPAVDEGDHPRGCGGTVTPCQLPAPAWGPSPRVRGNLKAMGNEGEATGTIPAGAGEPPQDRRTPSRQRDHPRGCGGTARHGVEDAPLEGPSPRVRGNRHPDRPDNRRTGTIPAGAGEPTGNALTQALAGDHPRGCGGT